MEGLTALGEDVAGLMAMCSITRIYHMKYVWRNRPSRLIAAAASCLWRRGTHCTLRILNMKLISKQHLSAL